MASYRDLIAWQKAVRLTVEIYETTKSFPREELYGLTSQLRRAAVSVPSNIAEGQARYSDREFGHFLANARGSLVEIETQLLIGRELGYVQEKSLRVLLEHCAELGRVLNGLRTSLRTREQG
jgi:four helix bundle protein